MELIDETGRSAVIPKGDLINILSVYNEFLQHKNPYTNVSRETISILHVLQHSKNCHQMFFSFSIMTLISKAMEFNQLLSRA